MIVFTKPILEKLAKNGKKAERNPNFTCPPVLKIFNPMGAATWLISWSEPEEPDILFGLCDLGMGFPELGSVRRSELESLTLPFGLKLERDMYIEFPYDIGTYGRAANHHQRIVTSDQEVGPFVRKERV